MYCLAYSMVDTDAQDSTLLLKSLSWESSHSQSLEIISACCEGLRERPCQWLQPNFKLLGNLMLMKDRLQEFRWRFAYLEQPGPDSHWEGLCESFDQRLGVRGLPQGVADEHLDNPCSVCL